VGEVSEDEMRLKALELAAAAVTNGRIHHYDVIILAGEYLAFLKGVSAADDDEPLTIANVDARGRRN
jgi:hypothetical protein